MMTSPSLHIFNYSARTLIESVPFTVTLSSELCSAAAPRNATALLPGAGYLAHHRGAPVVVFFIVLRSRCGCKQGSVVPAIDPVASIALAKFSVSVGNPLLPRSR
jgi:hypothetical protein